MRGGRSMSKDIRTGRGRSWKKPIPSDSRAGGPALAGNSPQSSDGPGIESEVLIGRSGNREQAPPAHGDRCSDFPGTTGSESIPSRLESNGARSFSELDRLSRWTHGWLHPACASMGDNATTAASISHAPAPAPAHRRRRTRTIMIDRLDEPGPINREIPQQETSRVDPDLRPTSYRLDWELACSVNLSNLARAGQNRKRRRGK
jgi:hypothetical protein